MEFKLYSEVVLPPERGTGIHKKPAGSKEAAPPEQDAAAATETVYIEEPSSVRGEAVQPAAPAAEPAPLEESPPSVPVAEPVLTEDLTRQPPPVSSVDPPAEPRPKARPRRQPPGERQTYLFAYSGQFLGQFSSSRRITHRKAFEKIAQRLAERSADFDPTRLELFKAVPIAIDRPEEAAKRPEGAFDFFAGESQPSSPAPNPIELEDWYGLTASSLDGLET